MSDESHDYPNALDTLSAEELTRLLERRGDGATAAFMLRLLVPIPSVDIRRVELRADQGLVVVEFLWRFVLPCGCPVESSQVIDAPLCPVTWEQVRVRPVMVDIDGGDLVQIVAAEQSVLLIPREERTDG